ncbi:MAG: carboxymuconolactone decarboxylase family protein [Acidimicrobiia bacterium]|nr:carboxymuconolactone decarboxylase family protein [Acidimicrobiia bacterium]
MTTDQLATTELDGACGPDGGCAITAVHGARIGQPAMVVPGAMAGLQAVSAAIAATGIEPRTLALVNLRASQVNACGVCLAGDLKAARQHGISDEELIVVAGWREAPYFSGPERAALALTEAVTRLADRTDPVPDDVWDAAARHYDEVQLAALVLAIANINVWNRLNVATRQVAGTYEW